MCNVRSVRSRHVCSSVLSQNVPKTVFQVLNFFHNRKGSEVTCLDSVEKVASDVFANSESMLQIMLRGAGGGR